MATSTGIRHGARKWFESIVGKTIGNASTTEKTASKAIAKERLQIILAHQRGSQVLAGVDLATLQAQLLSCVKQHIDIAKGSNIQISVKQEGDLDIFEMQVPVDRKSAEVNN